MVDTYQFHIIPEDDEARVKEAKARFTRYVHFMCKNAKNVKLGREHELELVSKAQEGCKTSLQTLVSHHWGMLRSMAYRVANQSGCPELEDDMVGEAATAFCKAIMKFDAAKDVRLNSFTKYHVIGELMYYTLHNGNSMACGKSGNERRAIYGKNRLKAAFKKHFGRSFNGSPADFRLMSEVTGIGVKALKRGFEARSRKDIPAHRIEIVDQAALPEDLFSASTGTSIVANAFDAVCTRLSERDRNIVHAVYHEQKRADDIGTDFNLTPERIRQIYRYALGETKRELASQGIHEMADVR